MGASQGDEPEKKKLINEKEKKETERKKKRKTKPIMT